MDKPLILVTGATGKQGGAVVRHLLKRGLAVRTITRDSTKPSAYTLAANGVEVIEGDMENMTSLRQAMKGVYGVFSVQNYWEKGVGFAGEIRQANNVLQAAKEAGVQHFVQSSIAGCDEAPGVEHFESKLEIEKLVKASGLSYTFLRTVWFMENFVDPKMGGFAYAVLLGALKPNTRFHMLSVEDIGYFAAEAFAKPEAYAGRTLELAGDSLTTADIKSVYAAVNGKSLSALRIPLWVSRFLNAEMAKQFRWNNQVGWRFDICPLRDINPNLVSFEAFLKRHASKSNVLRAEKAL
jgi:uncharacterized protein YbjT (DUF2867 family)